MGFICLGAQADFLDFDLGLGPLCLTIASGESGRLRIRGQDVPFVVFPNEDDITTGKPEQLATRLESVLDRLWEVYSTSDSKN